MIQDMGKIMIEAPGQPAFEIIYSGRFFETGDVYEIVIDDPDLPEQMKILISEKATVLVRYRDPKKMHEKTRGL